MERAHVDITRDLEGQPVVHACMDLRAEEIAASVHAVAVVTGERFRTANMSADDVLALRELTALADELAELSLGGTVVLRPARASVYCEAIAAFVDSREQAEWVRGEDAGHLELLRELLAGLEPLCAEAMRAALDAPARAL